jgi:hypothetical protein
MNRIVFASGIVVMISSALLFVLTEEPAAQITGLLIIGIILAAASKFRDLKTQSGL